MSEHVTYTVREFAQLMDDVPEAAQTVVQELRYGSGGEKQTPEQIADGARMDEDDVYDALDVLESEAMVRSESIKESGDRRYWLNVEDTA